MNGHRWLLVITLAILLAGCATPAGQPITTPTSPPGGEHLLLPNVLVAVKGRVLVRHPGSSYFTPAALGTEVQPGDTLRVTEGSAAIFCGDETLWDKSPFPLQPGRDQGVPCTSGRPPRPLPDLTLLRGEHPQVATKIPYVIIPRTGWVLSERPLIRWHPLAGVETYTVTLQSDDGLERPPIVVTGSELPYPADWPPLQANGATYVVSVEGGGRRSSEAGVTGTGFSLLPPQQAQRLREQEERLRRRPLQEPDLTLLLAELYRSYGLRSETVTLLAGAPEGENTVAVQLTLGYTYLDMGLFAEAGSVFERALALARQQGLLEIQARAHFGLGLAQCGLGREEDARGHWQAARDAYQQLGLLNDATQTETYLNTLTTRCSSR